MEMCLQMSVRAKWKETAALKNEKTVFPDDKSVEV